MNPYRFDPGRVHERWVNTCRWIVPCLALVLLAFLLLPQGLSANRIDPFHQGENPDHPADPTVSISTGESFTYYVSAYGFTAGNLRWTLENTKHRGTPALRVRLKGRSVGIVNLIGRFQGKLSSFVHPGDGYSLGYELSTTGESDAEPFATRFDYEKNLFLTSEGETGPLNGSTHDPLSMILYLRTRDLRLDRTHQLMVHDGESVERVRVRVAEQRRVATYAGWFDALKLEVSKIKGTDNSSRESRGHRFESIGELWLSANQRRIPLYITYPTRYGTVKAVLKSLDPGDETFPD